MRKHIICIRGGGSVSLCRSIPLGEAPNDSLKQSSARQRVMITHPLYNISKFIVSLNTNTRDTSGNVKYFFIYVSCPILIVFVPYKHIPIRCFIYF